MKNLKISDEAHYKLKSFCDLNNLKMNEWVSDKLLDLIKNNVYVEIAPRGTGKTYRLINEIKKHIESSNDLKIVVVTPNNNTHLLIKNRLKDLGVDISNIIFSPTMFIPQETVPIPTHRYFVDEFDYIDRKNLFISENGYYCTTLQNTEGDKFVKDLYQFFLNSRLWK